MKRLNTCLGVCLVGLMYALGVQAQRPEPVREGPERERPVAAEPEAPGEDGTGTTLGTAPELSVFSVIKFSGVLKDTLGQPRTGITGITFALYQEQEGGASLWLETQNIQPDEQGGYTVLLGAMQAEGLPRELFASGEARWLGIEVQGEPEQPRILLVSVPYALKAAEAETLGGRTATDFVLAERLETELREQAETIVREEVKTLTTTEGGTTKGITDSASTFTDSNSTQVVLVVQKGSGNGLRAVATAGSGSTKGLWGQSNSTGGRGVFGFATAGSGATIGVWGQSQSTGGRGVFGLATAMTGANFGVQGNSNSTSGRGVFGFAKASTGGTTGVLGQVSSAAGTAGVFNNQAGGKILSGQDNGTEVFSVEGANNTGTNGFTVRAIYSGAGTVTATIQNAPPAAIRGDSTTTSNTAVGVLGISASPDGLGVVGGNTATTGEATGVAGFTASTSGVGVLGGADAPTGVTFGVSGFASSTGVLGEAEATSGNTIGVQGVVQSGTGTAGVFNNQAGGKILSGRSTGNAEVFSVDGSGNVTASGVFTGDGSGLTDITATATVTDADTLDGLDSTAFAQLAADNTFSGTQTAPAFVGGSGSFGGNTNNHIVEVTQSDSDSGSGIVATTNAINGGAGVRGIGAIRGVEGFGRIAVRGSTGSDGTSGTSVGVWGQATSSTGNPVGVLGQAFSPNGTAGEFWNIAGGTLLLGRVGSFPGTEVFSVDGTGKLTAATGVFSADVPGGFVLDVTNTNTTGSDAIRAKHLTVPPASACLPRPAAPTAPAWLAMPPAPPASAYRVSLNLPQGTPRCVGAQL